MKLQLQLQQVSPVTERKLVSDEGQHRTQVEPKRAVYLPRYEIMVKVQMVIRRSRPFILTVRLGQS
jgi:hypothetical protein